MKFYPPLRDLHHSHTLTRDGHNGLCDPWHRCTTCGETDAGLAEPCNPAARIEELEAQVAELREAARGQIAVVEAARQMQMQAERERDEARAESARLRGFVDFVARTATVAILSATERVNIIAAHPTVRAWRTIEARPDDKGALMSDAEIEAHVEALLALGDLRGDGWRTMDDAPTDGQAFLAVVHGQVRIVTYVKTSHVPITGFCLADQGPEDFDLCNPTHWRPLPAPPTTEGE